MDLLFIGIILFFGFAFSIYCQTKLEQAFVRKMDELTDQMRIAVVNIWSGSLLIREAIKEVKTVKIPDEIVSLLKKISIKKPAVILDEFKNVYEEGLGDGAAELAKHILESLKESE